jgi:hypothetical protein
VKVQWTNIYIHTYTYIVVGIAYVVSETWK